MSGDSVTVSFDSEAPGEFLGLVRGVITMAQPENMVVSREVAGDPATKGVGVDRRIVNDDLTELRFYVTATAIKPHLVLPGDGQGFAVDASEFLMKRQLHSATKVVMTNPTQAAVVCQLSTVAPFSITNVEANGVSRPAASVISIPPGQSLEVELDMDLTIDYLNQAIAGSVVADPVADAAAAAAAAAEAKRTEPTSEPGTPTMGQRRFTVEGPTSDHAVGFETVSVKQPVSPVPEEADESKGDTKGSGGDGGGGDGGGVSGTQIESFPALAETKVLASKLHKPEPTPFEAALVPPLVLPPSFAYPPAGSVRIADLLTATFMDGTSQSFKLEADIPRTSIAPSVTEIDFGTCLAGSTNTRTIKVGNFGRGHAGWEMSSNMGCFTCSPASGVLEGYISKIAKNFGEVEVSYTPDGAGFFESVLSLEGSLGEPGHRIKVFGQGTHDEGIGKF